MSFRTSINHIKRGFGIIHSLAPSRLPLSVLGALINAALPLIGLYMSARIINELTNGRDAQVVTSYVITTVGLSFLLFAVRSVISRAQSVTEKVFHFKLYLMFGRHYMTLDFENVEESGTNDLLADIEAKNNGNGLGVMRQYWHFTSFIQHLFGAVISMALLVGMFSISGSFTKSFVTTPFATVLLAGLIALVMLFAFRLRKREQIIQKRIFESNPRGNTFASYNRNYIQPGAAGKDLRMYNQKSTLLDIFNKNLNPAVWHEYFKLSSETSGLTAAANTLAGGCVYMFIGLRALSGMYGIGSVIQYVGAVTSLVDNMAALVNDFGLLFANSEYLALQYRYLDLPEIKQKGSLTTEKRSDNEYEIEFHDVSFKYPGGDKYALRNLSLKFNIGKKIAIVGMNGSGKTTMIKLLCRLYDPTEGFITLNGIDIKKYDYQEYMNIFSVVFQDFKLLSFPLGQNVAASVEVDEVAAVDCLMRAGLGSCLSKMPDRLDTCLYKDFDGNGVEISGGEAQKIAIARALYKNAPFVVLDEPTAALDPIAEAEIYSKFNEISSGKTTIYISHRLSSCRFCDDIVVFHNGEAVQRGSHETLLTDLLGKYYELWMAQAQYYV